MTVCLDLNEYQVKFWLNDRRNPQKTIKLPEGQGPWVPCVKITQEKNRLILNPFAREPSDFYEKDFDKRFTLRKYLMPHLHNMVCITPSKEAKETAPSLKEFKLSASEIGKILLPKIPSTEQPVKGQNFCFLQFNVHDSMGEFIRKYKDQTTDYRVYSPYQIAEWFEKPEGELSEELRAPFTLISEHVSVQRAPLEDALLSLKQAY